MLRNHGVQVVRGNHERWLLSDALRHLPHAQTKENLNPINRDYIQRLPGTRRFNTPLGALLLCHGIDSDDMNQLRPEDEGEAIESNAALQRMRRDKTVQFIINGHTHHRMVRIFPRLTVINAGTLYREHSPSLTIVDFETRNAVFHFFDGPHQIRGKESHSIVTQQEQA